ncbi:UNVERIFIED_CONTAM: DNA-(apurinic or apyrimidinic site) lyase, chloroplastic [Sesamum angustifolium]|uniref:DNA-(apurinic or apyrimidinic site) endonuclease n=1 Tax=Sesamum angustifolium TaxID=2727405 RepID=A0AAW2MU83_9LAMI
MASRRLRSSLRASSAGNLDESTSVDAPKTLKNASKASTGRSGVLEDESEVIEKMTLQQMKSRLSSDDVYHPFSAGEDSLVLQYQEIPEKPAVRKTNSKRKAKGLSESDHIQITNDGSDISRGKRKKIQVEKSSEESVHMKSRQSTTEKELISQSTEIEGGRTKKKVSSRMTMSNIKARVKVDLSEDEPWTVLTHKKPQKGWAAYNPKIMRPPPITADVPHVKLMSWNVNGLRALLKLESFSALELAQRENFDVLCLQETKLQEKDVDTIRQTLLEGYDNSYWTCSVSNWDIFRNSYHFTVQFRSLCLRKLIPFIWQIKPQSVRYGLGISDHDSEGRLVTVEFDNFYLLCGYVPNSGDGLRRLSYRITQWDPSLSNYMKDLEQSKPVILTGDLNCAHQEIDIWNPAHPDVVGYTYWGYRHGGRKTNKAIGCQADFCSTLESLQDDMLKAILIAELLPKQAREILCNNYHLDSGEKFWRHSGQ